MVLGINIGVIHLFLLPNSLILLVFRSNLSSPLPPNLELALADYGTPSLSANCLK